MKKVIIILFVLFQCLSFAQLKKLTARNTFSSSDIYLDNNGNRYSTLVTVKFKELTINLPKGESNTTIDQIKLPEVRSFMNALVKKYGSFNLAKAIPSTTWGDTIRVNKRTGKTVYIKDMSQIFTLNFTNLVPVDSIASTLSGLPNIEYAVGPFLSYLTSSPDDPYYIDNNYQWSFDVINASQAWDITKGSPNIIVSINDNFENLGDVHEELKGKVVYRYSTTASGGHGTITAGVVGALTDNNMDIASLGWNTSVMFNNSTNSFYEVNNAVSNGADVINFSWMTPNNDPYLTIAIHNAILQGVVCVAAAGNNELTVPIVVYPAALNFGNDGQVIAVSGTEINNGVETFIPGFNYSPGTDPFGDPLSAFVDCAAPGANYRGLNDVGTTGTIHMFAGTSISAPFVSALAALILSINNSLIPTQVYDIITRTADKIGLDTYNSFGWNPYMGYGRINAYNALKYTVEHYGWTTSIPRGETKPILFSLSQNYPDPFNPSTRINFTIPRGGYVSLKIYDLLGKEIESLVNEYKGEGNYSIDFNSNKLARSLSSGIYIYQLREDNNIQTKKMVLLK